MFSSILKARAFTISLTSEELFRYSNSADFLVSLFVTL
nr:MAG TPA: hypothetical protein [Caudoviricetes sp.]